jgi:hypothetical protein
MGCVLLLHVLTALYWFVSSNISCICYAQFVKHHFDSIPCAMVLTHWRIVQPTSQHPSRLAACGCSVSAVACIC